jgi:hypothetical protein
MAAAAASITTSAAPASDYFCAASDGTALAGVNYTATKGLAVFEHGEDTTTVKIPLITHSSSNSSPSFTVRLELNPKVSFCWNTRANEVQRAITSQNLSIRSDTAPVCDPGSR